MSFPNGRRHAGSFCIEAPLGTFFRDAPDTHNAGGCFMGLVEFAQVG